MLQYYGFITVILLQALLIFWGGATPRKRLLFCIITGAEIAALIGLHSVNVGIDTLSYMQTFIDVAYAKISYILSGQSHMERGFLLLNKLLSFVSVNPQILFIVSGVIIAASVMRFIHKNTVLTLVGVLVYLSGIGSFYWALSALRQTLAISISLFAFEAVQKRRPWLFVLLVLVAATFHKSALCVLPLYPLYNVKFDIKTALLSGIVALAVFLNLNWILVSLTGSLSVYQGYVGASGLSYITDTLIKLSLLLFPCLILLMTGKKADRDFNILLWCAFFALIFSVFIFKLYMMIRFELYFAIYAAILIPKTFELITNKMTRYIFLAVFLFFTLLYTQTAVTHIAVSNNFLPYEFCWQNPGMDRRWNFTDGYMPW